MQQCYVYLIQCKSIKPYPVKVGVAVSPEKRIADLQTGNPYPLHLIASIKFDSRKKACEFEAFVHKGHRGCCMGGEWFKSAGLNINKSIRMWNSFKDSKSKAVKMSLKIANVHGSKAETENARLKQRNHALMLENKRLQQDIDDCLDSSILMTTIF